MANFVWQNNKPATPEAVAKQRLIAAALINPNDKPKNWGEGLASIAGAFSGNRLNQQAAEAEAEGVAQAGNLFGGLNSGSAQSDILAAASNPWASDGQSMIAQALLGSQLKQQDPMYQAQLSNALRGGDGPASVQEWQYYNNLAPEDQSRYLTMKRSNSPLNIGTGFVTQDQANPGQTIGAPIAINNQAAAFDTSTGTGLGKANAENIVSYESLASKMPGLRENMAELGDLAKKATYTQTGQLIDKVMRESGQEPSENAVARTKYIAAVDNQVLPLLRDTFGAAFTEREGATLRNTLGDPDKSPVEKQAILDAFIDQKERDLAAMQSRIPGASPPSGGGDQVFDAADFFGGN